MFLVNEYRVSQYLANDVVNGWLDEHSVEGDDELVCQRWLRQTAAKRFIFSEMYGDLLRTRLPMRVLDVGGGLTGVSRAFATHHHYILADLLAHDDQNTAQLMMRQVGSSFIRAQDWATLEADSYDLIIANDIFPNVDQRLEIFLQRLLPRTSRMRLSLTYYDVPRYYLTRRVDADEVLCMLAWNSEQLVSVLKKYSKQIAGADFEIFSAHDESVYPNGRQVCLIELIGGMAEKKAQ